METQLKNPSPKLLPTNSELRQFVNSVMDTVDYNMMVETLYLHKKPANYHTNPQTWDISQKTGLFNQLLAISTLAGIQYYSSSRGTMRTFFEYSQVIDNPGTKNPLPDPYYAVPPAKLSLYARQTDLTFGDNIYLYDYTFTGDAVFFVQENVTSMSVSIIPAIGKGNLKSVMAVFDCGDSILIYAVSIVKALSVPGTMERMGNSFSNRAEALLEWFAGRANLVFLPE